MTTPEIPPPTISTNWNTVQLTEPSPHGYFLLALSTGPWRLPPILPRSKRRTLLAQLQELAIALGTQLDVIEASVFRGALRPPGDRSLSGQWRGPVNYDVVLLVQTSTRQAAQRLLEDDRIQQLSESAAEALTVAGDNVRRIADVDHRRQGVFLFNFFTADDRDENLHVWQYTAGWFQDETDLDNSTVIGNFNENSPFALINHCRWDHLIDVLPSLVAKRSFKDFVLASFSEHRVAPHPALYHLHFSTAENFDG